MNFILVLLILLTEATRLVASFSTEDCYLGILSEVVVTAPSPDKVYLLARLLNAECAGEPYEGKLAVASVVINRMAIRDKSLEQVIYKPRQFGITSSRFHMEPDEQCLKAAYEVLSEGSTIPSSVIYFHNREYSTDTVHVNNAERNIYRTVGNHTFCHGR